MPDYPYNLLCERWIPVRDEAGHAWDIAPHEITKVNREHGTVPVALAAPRPDFNGALIQFLIGLVQSTSPPETERDWRRWFRKPPEPEELEEAFEPFIHAFNLYGEGPRFMQDLDVEFLLTKEPKNVQVMLLDAPSENAAKKNKDHFVKKQDDSSNSHGLQLSSAMAAAALFTYQINVPSEKGGADGQHQSTLRNGGPVTTLALGKSLWETIWLNVLVQWEVAALGDTLERNSLSDVFPWLTPTRTSQRGAVTMRNDVHPLQMYWPMPRRIVLSLVDNRSANLHCAMTGDEVEVAVGGYHTSPSGTLYKSPWHHPLSPSSGWNALNVEPGQFTYADWTAFATENRTHKPALVIHRLRNLKSRLLKDRSLRLWVFGFEMKQANIRAYRERLMPIYVVDQNLRADLDYFAAQLVAASLELAGSFRSALKEAFYPVSGRRPKEVTTSSFVQDTVTRFWRDSEPRFFRLLDCAHSHLEKYGPNSDLRRLRTYWLVHLRERQLLRLFDEVTQYGTFRGSDPRAVVQARRKLEKDASARNMKMRQLLDLPAPPRKKQ